MRRPGRCRRGALGEVVIEFVADTTQMKSLEFGDLDAALRMNECGIHELEDGALAEGAGLRRCADA
jgi:hypothetical protein